MNKELLKEILSIPSCSTKEESVREFLINWAIDNNIDVKQDEKGNIFMKKGELLDGESYPCVVAHMDTVHSDQVLMVKSSSKLNIKEINGEYGDILYATKFKPNGMEVNTGCGGDDKAGIFIALSLILNFKTIKGAFFVEEEIGCRGSAFAKKEEWLLDVGYFIQFDAPTDNWISRVCGGIELFDDAFAKILKPTWDVYNMSAPNIRDPFTDVKELKKNYPVCCINYFAGYMDMHSSHEFVVLSYVQKAINLGASTIIELGNKTYNYGAIQ